VSRYEWFRRRIAPFAFVIAIAVMARQSCDKAHHDHATFILDLGDAASDVRAIDAELWVDGTQLSVFHRAALAGTTMRDVRFSADLPAPDAELRFDVELTSAHRTFTRRVHAADGATVQVELGPDLHPAR
jgi:hypothetical protein